MWTKFSTSIGSIQFHKAELHTFSKFSHSRDRHQLYYLVARSILSTTRLILCFHSKSKSLNMVIFSIISFAVANVDSWPAGTLLKIHWLNNYDYNQASLSVHRHALSHTNAVGGRLLVQRSSTIIIYSYVSLALCNPTERLAVCKASRWVKI